MLRVGGISLAILVGAACSASSQAETVVANPDLGPVPIELQSLEVSELKECAAFYEWLRLQTSIGRLNSVGEEVSTLYRDVWSSALEMKLGRSIDVKDNLKDSEFRKYGADGAGPNDYREALAQDCTIKTKSALEALGFEVG